MYLDFKVSPLGYLTSDALHWTHTLARPPHITVILCTILHPLFVSMNVKTSSLRPMCESLIIASPSSDKDTMAPGSARKKMPSMVSPFSHTYILFWFFFFMNNIFHKIVLQKVWKQSMTNCMIPSLIDVDFKVSTRNLLWVSQLRKNRLLWNLRNSNCIKFRFCKTVVYFFEKLQDSIYFYVKFY